MDQNLGQILAFASLLNKFREVTRVILVPGDRRWENDVEHTFQLTLLAWYIADSRSLSLNKDLILKYALIHDLVEVYAGDVYAYSENKSNKEVKEREAVEKLKLEFPEFKEMLSLLEKYREQTDEESKFVYALDKVQPVIQVYLDGGRTWQEKGITLRQITTYKADKVAVSKEVEKLFQAMLELLENNESLLFRSTKK